MRSGKAAQAVNIYPCPGCQRPLRMAGGTVYVCNTCGVSYGEGYLKKRGPKS
jgi:DNA-directed RNA polymerase subunit RPC12/RpoP